jgi:outer membrane receptor protein involved in Fe transport
MSSTRFKSVCRASTALGALVLFGAAALPAAAQEVETVVVTAERHAEDIQDVPMSVAVIPAEELKAIFASGDDIRAIAARVPSLYAESSNGRVAPRFYIRGLGNTDFDLAASQPVSIIEDNVVEENVVLKSAPLYDMASVEVDRGPQGTLFGRNSTAGIVKFTTNKPTDDFEADGSVSFGELDTANVTADIGGKVNDDVSIRFSSELQHRGDYISNPFLGQSDALGGYDERAARMQLLWKPTDNFSLLLNVHGRSLDGTAAVFRANILTKGSDKLNANYIDDKVFFDGGFTDPKDENPQKYDGAGASIDMEYDMDGVKLTSTTAYEAAHGFSRGDIDGGNPGGPGFIPFQSDTQDGLNYLHQFTQELHLSSTDASLLFWQVGVFYFTTKYEDATNPFFVAPTRVRQSNTSWAGFAQASYAITDAFKVTAGVRYTSDVKGMTADGGGFFGGPGISVPVHVTGNNVSWDVSGEYSLDEDTNLYARVATGFRAPSIQGRNLAFGSGFSTARSETVLSYEAGVKTLLDDKKIRLNFDGFSYYISHMQLTAIGGSSNLTTLLNAHGGLAYGLEADGEYDPTDDLVFTAGASWNHTEIHDGTVTVNPCGAVAGSSLASLSCTPLTPYNAATGTVGINGNPFPNAPEYFASMTARYSYPLEDGAQLYAFTDWSLQGYTNFFIYRSAEFKSNGNYQGGLRIGYIAPDKVWEASIYARNITDKKNLQGAIDFDNLTGFVGDPRVIGVELDLHTR